MCQKVNVENEPNPKSKVQVKQKKHQPSDVITITDQIGRTVTLDNLVRKKFVSSHTFLHSITCCLGQEDKLVGIEMKADTREVYKNTAPQLLDHQPRFR